MAFANIQFDFAANTSEYYLPLPINNNIDREGYWYVYKPVNASNDTTGAEVKLYHWDVAVSQANTWLTIDGTIPLIYEEVDGSNTYYHAGAIEHVGEGINDITSTIEDNAIIFGHMGANEADDDAFYWDRFYLAQGETDWQYYQYHKHLPSFYVNYNQGRETTSGGGYINPEDKSYAYQIGQRVSSAGTAYQSRLARVHTPSIGGAHNSHNDVTLPNTGTRNYMSGGIIRGTGAKYHAMYFAQAQANTSNWDVYGRTYDSASESFTAQSTVGEFNLADPTFSFNDTTGNQQRWPIRASCGDVLGNKFYIPVVMTNQSNASLYDLEIWEFPSADPPDPGDLVRQVIQSSCTRIPDAQCLAVGSKLYVAYSDSVDGGVSIHSYNGSTWTDEGQLLTNSSSNEVRVHGFRYNSSDTRYYLVLSGTSSGGAATYVGDGVYSFKFDSAFGGYEHLNYDYTNHAWLLQSANTAGYVEYDIDNAVQTRYTGTEPEGIATDKRILKYDVSSPEFYRREEIQIGGEEYYYDGIELSDGRKCLVGRVEDLKGVDDTVAKFGNIIVTLIDADNPEGRQHFVYGGLGDDYTTGVTQASNGKIWLTGYTKSELVTKRDIKVHGYLRNTRDGIDNNLTIKDVVQDSNENYYTVGSHNTDGYLFVQKYDKDFDIVWQKYYDSGIVGADVGYNIAIDSNDNLYVCGSTVNYGAGGTDALVLKITTAGALTWDYAYGTTGEQVAKSIVVTDDSGTEYVVVAIESGTTTFMTVLNTDGGVTEVNTVANLNVNRLRRDVSGDTKGRFLFAGDNGANKIRYGMGEINSGSNRMIQWINGFSTSANGVANDIGIINNPDGSGNGADYIIVGNEESDAFALNVQVDETVGSFIYNVSKVWSRTLASCSFNAVVCEDYANPNWTTFYGTKRRIYVAGETPGSTGNGLIASYDVDGAFEWQNTFGFGGKETLLGIIDDGTQDNVVVVGTKTSHSFAGQDGMLFRAWKHEHGTGNYHITGNQTTKMLYQASSLTDSLNTAIIASISAPSDSTGTLTRTTGTASVADIGFDVETYDGSYGPNGLWMFWAACIDLNDLQTFINTDTYKNRIASGYDYSFGKDFFTFYQVATAGDGSADDGNIFGYDIIEHSGGQIVPVGVTSGNIGRINTGASGVYDYIIFHIDPTTGVMQYFQNGSTSDEEVYAVTELATGDIAFVGRSTGNLGGHTNQGGYDIFVGIHEMATHTTDYYQTGTGFQDVGFGIHEVGNNKLAVAFTTSGAFPNNTHNGGLDIGVIEFNYVTDTWGTAWQTGSSSAETVSQNGRHSTLLPDGRVAIIGQTSGFFADNATTIGLLDIFVGIVDRTDGTWKKYQAGTGANDFGTAIIAQGDKLLVVGYTEAAISDGIHGVYMEFDGSYSITGKATALS